MPDGRVTDREAADAPTTVRQVIVDRDGVLNRELAEGWLRDPAVWSWEPGSRRALAALRGAGMRVSVVTNQSGIGRGVVTRAEVEAVHRHMVAEAARGGGAIADVLLCPHAPDAACACRKPAPGLVLEALRAAGTSPEEAIVVGDDDRDLRAGLAAGTRVALVRTGKGRRTEARWDGPAVPVFDDLEAATGWIIEHQDTAEEVPR